MITRKELGSLQDYEKGAEYPPGKDGRTPYSDA